MDRCRGNSGTVRSDNREKLETYTGKTATESPSWHRAFIREEKSFLERQERHEKALKDLENTILFLEKIAR